jgi:hypothetical protein
MAGYRAPDPQRPQIQRIAYRQTQTARVVGLVLMWSIIALVALAADRAIPREHLPWKPLALVDPIGAATRIKAARTGEDPAACREVLKQGGVEFVDVASHTSGFCDVHDAVRIEAGMAPLSPTDAPMTCKQALAVSLWERQVVQQAAFDAFGQAVVGIDHYGAYACRRMYGRDDAPVSEHATANALDVAAFRLADGTVISVQKDWGDAGPRGRFLHAVRDGACRVFLTTLSPDYNDAHHDHFHLDMGGMAKCA